MIRRPPRSTLFPTRRSSDLVTAGGTLTEQLAKVRKISDPKLRDEVETRIVRVDALKEHAGLEDRKSTRLNSSHDQISYAVFCLKKKKNHHAIDSIHCSDLRN